MAIPHELDFLRNIARENSIWLDNVRLVKKDRFFTNVRNASLNIQYDPQDLVSFK